MNRNASNRQKRLASFLRCCWSLESAGCSNSGSWRVHFHLPGICPAPCVPLNCDPLRKPTLHFNPPFPPAGESSLRKRTGHRSQWRKPHQRGPAEGSEIVRKEGAPRPDWDLGEWVEWLGFEANSPCVIQKAKGHWEH